MMNNEHGPAAAFHTTHWNVGRRANAALPWWCQDATRLSAVAYLVDPGRAALYPSRSNRATVWSPPVAA